MELLNYSRYVRGQYLLQGVYSLLTTGTLCKLDSASADSKCIANNTQTGARNCWKSDEQIISRERLRETD